MLASINSCYGHFRHGNCLNLRKRLYYGYFKELAPFFEPADRHFSYFVIRQAWLDRLSE